MIRLSIRQEDVLCVYSGKPGCACGCRGKYSYASKLVKEASKNRGYEVTPDEVSDRNIKRILNKIEVLASMADKPNVELIVSRTYVSVTFENRVHTLYFRGTRS